MPRLKKMLSKASAMSMEPAGPNKIRIGRQQAALGLLWQPARSGMSVRDQAALAGSGTRVFGLVAPAGDGRQLGFATADKGFASGMLAGATLFDGNVVGDTWVGAFPVGNGEWWIVAVRDGWIYEDLVCRDAESAEAAFRKLLKPPTGGGFTRRPTGALCGAGGATLSALIDLGAARPASAFEPRVPLRFGLLRSIAGSCLLGYGWREFAVCSKHGLSAKR